MVAGPQLTDDVREATTSDSRTAAASDGSGLARALSRHDETIAEMVIVERDYGFIAGDDWKNDVFGCGAERTLDSDWRVGAERVAFEIGAVHDPAMVLSSPAARAACTTIRRLWRARSGQSPSGHDLVGSPRAMPAAGAPSEPRRALLDWGVWSSSHVSRPATCRASARGERR